LHGQTCSHLVLRLIVGARVVITTAPGEEGQVDYGEGPMVRHPDTGKYRRTRLFVLTLGYSRKAVRLLVWQSSTQIWAELHERAFRRLGGTVRVIVLDNLKEGVLTPDIYDPALNPLYRDVLAHYGVVAFPHALRHADAPYSHSGAVRSRCFHIRAKARRVSCPGARPRAPCELVSRNGHVFKQWPQLAEEIAHAIRAHSAVLDGEICCLKPDGRTDFNKLLFQREWPHFYAFDVLSIDGRDLIGLPLLKRKRLLLHIMPRIETRLLYLDHIENRGCDLFRVARERDLEGIVAKWAHGRYQTDGRRTSWVKIRNPAYSQLEGRHDLFERRRHLLDGRRGRAVRPELSLV
jgi:ATP dependent DNA ligase-like protein